MVCVVIDDGLAPCAEVMRWCSESKPGSPPLDFGPFCFRVTLGMGTLHTRNEEKMLGEYGER